MSDPKFVVRRRECDLWITNRAGSYAEWGSRSKALAMTRAEWDRELSGNLNRSLIQFEPVGDEPQMHPYRENAAPSPTLKSYNPVRPCPKCNYIYTSDVYLSAEDTIQRECTRCQHSRKELPLDRG